MENSTTKNKLPRWQTLSAVFVALAMTVAVLVNFSFAAKSVETLFLFPLCACFAAAALYTRSVNGELSFKVLCALFVWLAAASLLNSARADFSWNLQTLYGQLFCYGVCFALPLALDERRRDRVLSAVMALPLTLVTALSAFGIYVAIQYRNIDFYNTTGNVFGLDASSRLSFCCNPNFTGVICLTALIFCGFIFAVCKKRLPRILLSIAALVNFAALALSDSRTAIYAAAAAAAVAALRGALWLTRDKKLWLRVFAAALAALAAALAVMALSSGVKQGMRAFATQQQQADVAVSQREDGTSSDERLAVWKKAFVALVHEPLTLLRGNSPVAAMSGLDSDQPHFHNSFIQMLMSGGLPALALLLWVLVRLFLQCWRLYCGGAGAAGVLVPAGIFALLLCACYESYLFVNFEPGFRIFDAAFFLLAGWAAAAAGKAKKSGGAV